MNESPRSSKRRKLDTPSRPASSPLVKATSARKSSRVTSRFVSNANGGKTGSEEDGSPKRSAPKNNVNGAGRLHNDTSAKDVWDDIEGALGELPARSTLKNHRSARMSAVKPTPSKRPRQESKASVSNNLDERQPEKSASKRSRGSNTANGQSASRATFRTFVDGHRLGDAAESANQDELATEALTPSRRTQERRTTGGIFRGSRSGQKPNGASPLKTRAARKLSRQTSSEAEDELAFAVPAQLRRRQQPRFQDDSTVLETEDETVKIAHSSSTKVARARRRAHRVDHADNGDEEVSDGEQAEADVDEADEDAMSVDGNSIIGSVLDPTEPSPFNKPTSAQKEDFSLPHLRVSAQPSRELDVLKKIIMERLTGKRPAPLIGLEEEYKSVYQLIEHTITAGEGNSMLVIGARGSGKSALVNKILSEVSKDNSEDFHVVRLNGFIHTDDKIALREIWRQLGKEMDLEEDGGGVGKNYADTLTTLLALLSHPSEQTGEMSDQTAKAVVFVMDEFDLFAQHPRQTLLYNLFDIAQSRKAPIAVLGLTTRIDVANSLEKRVKSRFSHRYVHSSLAKNFSAFQEMCKANLIVTPNQLSVEERGLLEAAATQGTKKAKKGEAKDVLSDWNAGVNSLFASKSFLTAHLAAHFYRTKSLPTALTSFLLPTATLSPGSTLYATNLVAPPDSKLSLLPHLSTLGLSLLIAAARLDIIHDSDTVNFNMAYDEYITLASKARIQSAAGGSSASSSMSKVWSKEVARREWEELVDLGLILPAVGGQTGGFSMVKCDVALEEIGAVLMREKGVEKGLERWCKQI